MPSEICGIMSNMLTIEKEVLERIIAKVREVFPGRIASVYAFGSRVRGDHDGWSDFDVLVVVREKTPLIESGIINIFVDEEIAGGVNFTPVVKDFEAFELEKRFQTPFYKNVTGEGVLV